MLLVSLSVVFSGCLSEPKIDLCTYLSNESGHCFPLNQEGKEEYDIGIKPGDIFLIPDDVGKLKNHHNDLHKKIEELRVKQCRSI